MSPGPRGVKTVVLPPTTRVVMRQLAHKAIAIFFWVVLVVLWYALVVDGRAGAENITYSVQYVAVVAGGAPVGIETITEVTFAPRVCRE